MQPGKLHRGARGGFWIGRRHRIGAEIEGLAGMTQTDLGLAREIHRQIGGSAKEIGARLFESRGGTSLEEMEIGILHDILRLLSADAAPGKSVQFTGVGLI